VVLYATAGRDDAAAPPLVAITPPSMPAAATTLMMIFLIFTLRPRFEIAFLEHSGASQEGRDSQCSVFLLPGTVRNPGVAVR
jgi:hypothetical protein